MGQGVEQSTGLKSTATLFGANTYSANPFSASHDRSMPVTNAMSPVFCELCPTPGRVTSVRSFDIQSQVAFSASLT